MRAILLLLALAASTLAQSAWLPAKNTIVVSTTISHQQFTRYWAGPAEKSFNSPINQNVVIVTAETGISDSFAADLTVGYAANKTSAIGVERKDSGLTDSSAGIRCAYPTSSGCGQ